MDPAQGGKYLFDERDIFVGDNFHRTQYGYLQQAKQVEICSQFTVHGSQ